MRLVCLLPAAALMLSASFAFAQTAPATNPLRPATTRTAPQAAPSATTTAPAAAPEAGAKPKRARSEAQLANDNRMKACGAEWRTNKDALKAQGKTWKVFNVECRARMKAQGR